MFVGQRLDLIRNILIEQKSVTTNTLCGLLNVSDVTVRKYFDILEKEAFLIKVHGGAILANNQFEPASDHGADYLKQISALAVTLLSENEIIFIGDGAICREFASQIPLESNISVITNNVDAVPMLSYSAASLALLGGQILRTDNNIYTVGPSVCEMLKGRYISKAFISPFGISLEAGITTNDYFLFELTQQVMQAAKETIVIAKGSAFGSTGMYCIAPIERVRAYVTNCEVSNKYKEFFFNRDIKLLTSFGE